MMLGAKFPTELIPSAASAGFKTDPDKLPDQKVKQTENRVGILDDERGASSPRSSVSD